jgi:GLPGLI family protein
MDKTLVLFLTLFVQLHVVAQTPIEDKFKYKATYDLTYLPDSTDLGSVQNESMVLYVGDKLSRFSSEGKAVGDSIKAKALKQDKSMVALQRLQGQLPNTNFSYYIFKLRPSGKIYFTEKIATDNLLYQEDLPMMEWEIRSETKEILGYETQKATTKFAGRQYTAWFTSEIPITDGPYKFSGLPGLILEVADGEKDYSFTLVNFKVLEPSAEIIFSSGDHMTVTKEEFNDIKDNYDQNPFAALERSGIKIHFTPAQEKKAKRDIKEKLEKNNNPLELR